MIFPEEQKRMLASFGDKELVRRGVAVFASKVFTATIRRMRLAQL